MIDQVNNRGQQPPGEAQTEGLRLLAMDVDGTLTDGGIWIGPGGEALKRFSVRDGYGLTLLRRAGLELAIITGRRSDIVQARAQELQIRHVMQGVKDKAQALSELCASLGIDPIQSAFFGDDWPDLPAMRIAGLALAPSDAEPPVRASAHWVSSRPGGHGAVREFAEWWLARRGLLAAALGDAIDGTG